MIRSTFPALGALALLAAAACTDAGSFTSPAARPLAPALLNVTGDVAASRYDSPLVNAASGLCVTLPGTGIVTPAALAPCAPGAPNQLLNMPPAGSAGLVQLFGGSVCLDDFGAQGQAGDEVGIFTCYSGSPTQTWSLNSAGELRGVNDLCVTAMGTGTGAAIRLHACTGAATQRWTASASSAPSTTLPPANTSPVSTDAQLQSKSSGLCLTLPVQIIVTPATVAQCAGAAGQLLIMPAAGTSGPVQLFNGSVCLDDFGAQGNVGDIVGIFRCYPGAAPQTWTLTTAGELRGINDLCVSAVGPAVLLQRCTGSESQRWTLLPATTTGPLPTAPVSAPPVISAPPVSAPALPGTVAAAPQLPLTYVNTDYVAPTGQRIVVNAGGDFQAAINAAQPGDVIELEAGATFVGNFILKAKPGSGWITIRTTAPDWRLPPLGQRISPAYAPALPKIVSPNPSHPILAENGAHHYRIMGVEVTSMPSQILSYGLVVLGDGLANSLAELPHHIVLDRVYLHGTPTLDLYRCVALNGASMAVIDSYLADCHSGETDSQAIMGWTGTGPYKIVNNYLEGAGENIMFGGGGDPRIDGVIASDIEIRRNHLYKPISWRGGRWVIKNLFELKNAQRVLMEGNVLENNWMQSQDGIAVLLKSENQGGRCTWCVTRHVTFRYNRIKNAGGGMIMGGYNKPGAPIDEPLNNVLVQHNTFENINGLLYGGNGLVFQFADDARNIVIDHNSMNPPTVRSTSVWFHQGARSGFAMTNNVLTAVVGSGQGAGIAMFPTYAPDMVFTGNALVSEYAWDYGAGNIVPPGGTSMYMNADAGDFSLSFDSPLRGAGTGGSNIGVDYATLLQKTSGVVNP